MALKSQVRLTGLAVVPGSWRGTGPTLYVWKTSLARAPRWAAEPFSRGRFALWHGSIAENIALTVRGPDVVLDLWVESEPHRQNLDDCSFTHHGLGLFRDRWTQVLIEDPDD